MGVKYFGAAAILVPTLPALVAWMAQAMASPDIWVGTRAEIADHVLSVAAV